jgi:cell division transport system ATP-binding protein
MGLFREINDMGTTVLVATHDETLMAEFPSRTIELSAGQVISDQYPALVSNGGFGSSKGALR